MKKKIVIVGAGPGGLSAAMQLAYLGHDVHVYEKESQVGGRNGAMTIDGYTFDIGPTFYMMPFVLEEIFQRVNRQVSDYLDMKEIDPLYRLRFRGETDFYPTRDKAKMLEHIEALFPGDSAGYQKFMEREAIKFARIFPCLQDKYLSIFDYLKPHLFKALPYLDAHKSVYDVIAKYMKHEDLRISMTFQAKYLGMSPWDCMGMFTMLPYIEHEYGIWHPIGGLNQISEAMAKVAKEYGGHIHLGEPVEEVLVEQGSATGLRLTSGDTVQADTVVLNADFAYAMSKLVQPINRRKYTNKKLEHMKYSCSTFMLYLGLDKYYDIPHHNIIFADNYKENVLDIVERGVVSEDPSIYIQNACATDPTLAPEGHSTLYVLVPVPNNSSGIDWATEGPALREKTLKIIEQKTELKDIRQHITLEKVITPADWERGNIYRGATFNLGHNLNQMLYFRPRNKFEEFDNCYLVGGGTHPGSGLPTILESGKICADLIGQA